MSPLPHCPRVERSSNLQPQLNTGVWIMDAALSPMARPHRAWRSENLSRRASLPDIFHYRCAFVTLSIITTSMLIVVSFRGCKRNQDNKGQVSHQSLKASRIAQTSCKTGWAWIVIFFSCHQRENMSAQSCSTSNFEHYHRGAKRGTPI